MGVKCTELGIHIKTFISESLDIMINPGITHDIGTHGDFDISEFRVFLTIGLRWYL